MWAINNQEMRSISETGELGDKPILLNKPRKSEPGDQSSASALLNGYPGETIDVGEDRAAILITNRNGGSFHRVALLDLKQLRVDRIVRTMTESEEKKILGERWANAVLLNALLAGAAGAAGGAVGTPSFGSSPIMIPQYSPNLSFRNEMLAARPDGEFLYVLDMDSHEVTIIDVQPATVLRRIPVDHSVSLIQVSADGKHLLCLGKNSQKIDLDSNNLEN